MASHYRFLVALYNTGDPARDEIVNTLYFAQTTGSPILDTDLNSLGSDLLALYDGLGYMPVEINHAQVKIYDMADAEPRVPKATVNRSISGGDAMGPREVALCLSFYSQVNRPRSRGRIYMGPFPANRMAVRPTSSLTDTLRDFGIALGNLGGVDIDWNIHSVKDNDFKKVSNIWVDNEWDTVRSRGLRAEARSIGTVSE